MKMKCLVPFTYAGKNLAAGDEFDASEKDVRILTAIKKAKAADVADGVTYGGTDDATVAEASQPAKHNRKDMRAK